MGVTLERLLQNKTTIARRNLEELMALANGREYRPDTEQESNESRRRKRDAPIVLEGTDYFPV